MTKKVWTILGQEFEKDAGKTAVIVRELDSLNSAGTAFSSLLAR